MGDYGVIDRSAYSHPHMSAETAEKLETVLASWLARQKPGSFSSRDACGCYDKALAQFSQWSGLKVGGDVFEIALARLGFRAGTVVFNGESRWLLILPSSLDTALDRLANREARL